MGALLVSVQVACCIGYGLTLSSVLTAILIVAICLRVLYSRYKQLPSTNKALKMADNFAEAKALYFYPLNLEEPNNPSRFSQN